jgi:two-component system sensor histidine kinase KdpD
MLRVRLLAGLATLGGVLAVDGLAEAVPWLAILLVIDSTGMALWMAVDRGLESGPERGPAATATDAAPGGRNEEPGAESLVLRTVCHELRAPVTSLGSLTRALGRDEVAPDVRMEIAQLAHRQAVHLDGLLRQAVAVTRGLLPRSTGGGRSPLRRVVPVAAGVVPPGRLRSAVSPDAAERLVDAPRLQHILTNLLENAVRHGPADGEVRLGAWTDRRGLVLTVADRGVLGPDLSAALSRSTPPEGMSGLGLWLVRRLAAADGGTVAARADDRGLVVEVVLPPSAAWPPHRPEPHRSEPHRSEPNRSAPAGRSEPPHRSDRPGPSRRES